MLNYKQLSFAHELVFQLNSHYLVHITGGRHPDNDDEFMLVSWDPLKARMNFKELDTLIEKLIELLEYKKEK